MKSQSALQLAVKHLNASVGQVLSPEQLASALRAGTVRGMTAAAPAAALVSSVFTELSPELILRCAEEAHTDVLRVNQLYRESLADKLPRAETWEHSVGHFL